SKEKTDKLLSLLPSFIWLPTINAVVITGSVAVGNAREDEDIDLMILTTEGFLWSTRILIQTILWAKGALRLRSTKNVKDRLCLNLWLDASSLSLAQRSLYVARELIQTKWIFDRGLTKEQMLASNNWIARYVNYSRSVQSFRDPLPWKL